MSFARIAKSLFKVLYEFTKLKIFLVIHNLALKEEVKKPAVRKPRAKKDSVIDTSTYLVGTTTLAANTTTY